MEPELTKLCADCLELTCVTSKPPTGRCRTISAYRASSICCTCCDFISRHFDWIVNRALSRFTQFERQALDDYPAELSTITDETLPSGLRVVFVEAGISLPNAFCYTFRFTISSCCVYSKCATAACWRVFPTTHEAKLLQLKEWLTECNENHTICHESSEMELPKRLIELDNTKKESARLVYTNDLDTTDLRYTSLSYCWGDSNPVKTLRENLSAFHTTIPWTGLPKTLQDAMFFTQEIGIRYIWIDALCIVQDDPVDWETEADKMHDVYTGSYLTFFAREAHSSDGGCFAVRAKSQDTDPRPLGRSFFTTAGADNTNDIRVHLASENELDRNTGALSRRGWCCQELQMSRRAVEVVGSELQWHCLTDTRFETGYRCESKTSLQRKALDPRKIKNNQIPRGESDMKWNRLWGIFIEEYTRCRFTYSRDRLSALAGTAHMYHRMTGDKPCLGLWRNTLPEDLTWMRHNSVLERELDSESSTPLPSWCPLSCRQSVTFRAWNRTVPGETEPESCIEILRCSTDWAGKPFVSDLRESVLIVNGPVRILHLSEATEIPGCNPPYFNVDHEVLDFEKHPIPWRCAVQWDQEGYRSPGEWLCLLIERRPMTGYELGGETFLVLDVVDDVSSGKRYRRVGIGSMGRNRAGKDHKWKFELTKRSTINLL